MANNGDVLRGRALTWNEIAVVPSNKHVTIDGGYDAAFTNKIGSTTVTNTAPQPVFLLQPGAQAYLQSLIIQGGDGTGTGAGGIHTVQSTAIVVTCEISGCQSGMGAGLYSAGVIIVSNSLIANNTSTFMGGGGVYVSNGAAFFAYHTDIRDNVGNGGGGGIWSDGEVLEIHASTLVSNTASRGGGVCTEGGRCTVRDSSVIDNLATADKGGGIFAYGELIISNAQVLGNNADEEGGGVYAMVNKLAVYDSVIGSLLAPNVCEYHEGGGMYVDGATTGLLRNVVFEGNNAYDYGGAYLVADSLWASNVIARHNNCQGNGNVWFAAFRLRAYDLQMISNTGGGGTLGSDDMVVETLRVLRNSTPHGLAGVYLWGSGSVHRVHVQYNRSDDNGDGGMEVTATKLTISDLFLADNNGDANNDGVGGTGGLASTAKELHIMGTQAPVIIARNHGARVGGLQVKDGRLALYGSLSLPVWITDNTAAPTSGVGAVCVLGEWQGATAALYGAVHVLSNSGYHGGVLVSNRYYSWTSNQAYFVAAISNGSAAQLAYNRSRGPGGSLYVCGPGAGARLHGARVAHNVCGTVAPGGGGAAISFGGEAHFIYAQVFGNFSSNSAGGVAVVGTGSRVYFDADFAAAALSYLPPTRVQENYAQIAGGGVAASAGAQLYVYHSLVASNRAITSWGGGLLVQSATTDVRNAVITRNHAGMGGDGLAVVSAPLVQIINATVAHNNTNGIRMVNTPSSFIINTIVWGHGGAGHEFTELMYTSALQHCTVQGGYNGSAIVTNDPQFLDVSAMDYQLSDASSPCVDQGIPISGLTNDCLGNTRPQMAAYDIGAYEFVPEPAGAVGALVLAWVLRMYAKRAAA